MTIARKTILASMAVSKLCSYVIRHERNISHGNDGGAAISVILNDVRIRAGGGFGRPHVHDGAELIEMFKKGSNKLRLEAF